MRTLFFLFALLFIVGIFTQVSSQSSDDGLIAEVYFVAGPDVVKKFVNLGYTKQAAIQTIRQDMNFWIYETNKYFATLEKAGGLRIKIRMTKLDILDEELFEKCKLINDIDLQSDLALAVLRAHLDDKKAFQKSPYDIAVGLTAYDLFGTSKSTNGYAQIGAACSPGGGLAVAEYDGTQSFAVTLAHELAHSLGAPHDNGPNCHPNDGYIMTPRYQATNRHRWEFSVCSVENMYKYINSLDRSNRNCLINETTQPAPDFDIATLNGRDVMEPKRICERTRNDLHSYLCTSPGFYGGQPPHGDRVCNGIFCGQQNTSVCRRSTPTELMVCDPGKRCQKGKCVKAPANLPVPNSVRAGCVFGDTKSGKVFGVKGDCENYLVKKGVGSCYNRYLFSYCCKTCTDKKNGISDPNCQWGDKSRQCAKYPVNSLCPSPNNRKLCCYKCRNWKSRGKRSNVPVVPYDLLVENYKEVDHLPVPIEFDEEDVIQKEEPIVNIE